MVPSPLQILPHTSWSNAESAVSNQWMAKPRALRIGWVQISLIGLALLAGSCGWFYFHDWQAIKRLSTQSADGYPLIWFEYRPPLVQALATITGLALFLGGLTFGLSRSAYRLLRRLLSPGQRVR
jgi:hypothetical protein